MAEMNWWGTDSPSPTLFWGEVDYVPFLLSPPRQDHTTGKEGNFGFTTQSLPKLTLTQNIVSGNIKILLQNIPENALLSFYLYDITGRVLKSGTVNTRKSERYVKIPLFTTTGSEFPTGVYFLKVGINKRAFWLWRILNL